VTTDRIIITQADGQEESLPLTFRGLNIGSGSKNDLILSGPGMSQQHLRITFDGATAGYSLLPLPASLPAYLDEEQLLPSVERAWGPGQVLRLGQHTIRLERRQTDGEPPAAGRIPGPAEPVEPEPQPLSIFLIGMVVLIIVVIGYIIMV